MLSFLRNSKLRIKEFKPSKEMFEAAILKGKRIGLKREEIIEMASLMDKKMPKNKIEKIVTKLLA